MVTHAPCWNTCSVSVLNRFKRSVHAIGKGKKGGFDQNMLKLQKITLKEKFRKSFSCYSYL